MNTKRYIGLMSALLVALTPISCQKDLLDIKPIDFVSDAAVFQDITLTSQFVNDIYGTLLSGFERRDFGFDQDWAAGFALLDMMTDDLEGHNDLPMNTVQAGDLTSHFSMGTQMWAANYTLIRKANTLIARIDGVPTTDTDLRDRLKAEARFLRAFAYAELIKAFGGVPLILTEQSIDDDLEVPRDSYERCVEFIVQECDEAAPVLPPTYDNADLGRATKGAALALKARTLLFYASPLNNPANEASRWDAAAKAAQEVIEMAPGVYKLHDDYYRLFMDKTGNQEVIFVKKFARPSRTHQTAWMLHMSIAPNPWGAWGACHPTQNLVDCFEMTNGLLPDESGSGYDAQNPYANRDSRLDKAILHNGSQFKGITVETFQSADLAAYPDGNANGRTNGDRTKTGYGLRKFIDDRYLTSDAVYQGGDNDWVYMRYAEVLLNYAEARNEFSGPDASVYDALDEVRERAGQPALPRNFTKETLREKIRNERRVELCFEEHRVYDVRRWKTGMTYFNGPVYRMNIVKNADGTLTYNRRAVLEQRVYKESYNLFPIPQMEIERNRKLDPND
ncbi:RagB/SusD family nutrient uptake outer membrane protein [Sphingobacterium sp. FBM7-1]|uniref:RagB/SusD family nutrient uptake outer membrane protein n=1 Tax=Sphingobacterium sp. FBM7-1 TaxID=2886688 RepID=UPI001D105C69|nr:RagB/SusD family nutrient uptake outer membrane protein [Sphingobacterium sp. FBM7-1]MCC2600653.1 RagB/SusD family nutrient uptake outer membrane protein [Sphingobacterium sp. FBM7-1]